MEKAMHISQSIHVMDIINSFWSFGELRHHHSFLISLFENDIYKSKKRSGPSALICNLIVPTPSCRRHWIQYPHKP